MSKIILMTDSALLVLAVAICAFVAHGLNYNLSNEMMQVYKTGVEYHFYHALGLLLVGLLSVSMPSGVINWSSICLTAGIVLFSGSLYLLSITSINDVLFDFSEWAQL